MTPSPPPVTQEEHDTHSEIYRIAVVVTGDQPTADEIALRLVAAGYRKPTPLPDDLEELERLARKAEASKFAGMYGYREVRDLQNACTPQRILSLLARLRGVTDVEGERGAAEGRPEAVTIYKCVNCGGRGVCAQLYPDKGTTERRTWQCRVCNGTGQARIASSPVATDGLDK